MQLLGGGNMQGPISLPQLHKQWYRPTEEVKIKILKGLVIKTKVSDQNQKLKMHTLKGVFSQLNLVASKMSSK